MTLLSKGIPLVFAGTLILGACEDGRRAQSSVSSSSRSITGSVTVHGSVTDGQGHPIVGATLAFLQSGTDAAIAQSAAGSDAGLDGTYSIEIGSGTYTVIVTPPSSSALQPLTLTNQQFDTSMRFDVVLVPEGSAVLRGHVLDQVGAPAAGASVSLNGYTTGLGYASATTDSSGFYQVVVLPGDYGLTLSDSFTSLSNPDAGTAGIDAGSSTSIYTSYGLGGYSVHVDGATTFDLTVPTPKILSGQVVDVDGTTPIAGASVMSSMAPTWSLLLPGAGHDGGTNPTFGNQNFSTTTDANGRFKLSLLPGSGQVQASIAGKPTAFASVTLVDDTEITIRFLSTAMVSGHALDQLGAPVAGASVSLNGNTTGLGYASATTDSSGFYQVAVLPGDYGLTLSDSFTSFSNPDAGTAGIDAGSSTSIYTSYSLGGYSVHVDGATTFDLTVPTPKTLSGQVVDVDGTTPIAGASVISSMMPTWSLLLPGAGHDGGTNPTFGNQNFSTATGADGRFKLSLLPGSGAITINPAQSPWLVPPTIPVNNFTEDTRIVIAVQFVSDSASAVVDPGESLTTDRSGTGATPTDPVATTVQIPPSGTSGAVVIDESLITQPPADPTAWVFLTQQVTIDAPPATADSPLVLTFLLDGSRLRPGEQASDIHMFRDGLQVLPCSNPASGIADPAPCVSEQGMSGDDVRFVVLTDHASNWNFGIAAAEVGGAGGANGAGAGGTSGGSGNGGASGSGTNGKGGVYGGGAGVVIIPTGSGGSPGGSPDGSVGGGQSTSSGGAGGTALNSAGSGGAGSTGTVGPPGAGLDASATEDGGQSAAVDGEVATAMDALTVRDAAGSTIDGPATASSGIDGAMAPSADTAAMVDAGLADAAPAAAIDGAGATLVDAVRSGGKPDGGIDASRAASSSAGGCGCDLAGHGRQLPSLWAAALAACAFLLARRRRR